MLPKEQHASLEQECTDDPVKDPLCQHLEMGLEKLESSTVPGLDHSLCIEKPPVNAESSQENLVQANPSGSEFCNSLAAKESSQNSELSMLEENDHNVKRLELQGKEKNFPISTNSAADHFEN